MADTLKLRDIEMLVRQHQGGLATALRVSDAEDARAKLARVVELARDMQRRVDAINADEDLTPVGRAKALAAAAANVGAALDKMDAALQRGLAEHKAALEAELASLAVQPEAGDVAARVERALLRSEIRNAARGLNAQGIEMLYRMGSPTVRAALEELPRIEVTSVGLPRMTSFITEALKRDVLLEAGKARRPDTVALLDDMAVIGGAWSACAGALRTAIKGVADQAADALPGKLPRDRTGAAIDARGFVDPQTGGPLPRA